MKYIGLDAGSVSVKLVLLDEAGDRLLSLYRRHRGRPLSVALEMLNEARGQIPGHGSNGKDFPLSVTGSAGRLIGRILGIEPINEVVAFSFATRRFYPHIRTIIELGGEDSKLIILGEDSISARDFSMNSVCAAGTGSFLDQQAERLRLSIEEFSEMSLKSKTPPRIAGRCSVFAKSDMIHLQQIATPVEDIVAGLCFAVARNFKGSIARGREMISPISFQGGVAANAGMIRAFKEILGIKEIFVPAEYVSMGAIGAALKGMESGKATSFELSELEDFIRSVRTSEKGHEPLVEMDGDFYQRHRSGGEDLISAEAMTAAFSPSASQAPRVRAYLGVDVGSISTNLAVIGEDCRLIAKRYLMTAGRPIEAVKQGLSEIAREVGDNIEIIGAGTTGSGRYMIADYIGADIVKNEITAQATAAAFIDRNVDTIFEIGGQDSKYISLRDGVIVDFEMNKACAAGTGSFLEEQAEKLNISIKGEFERMALHAGNPCRLGERCTVFMENSLMANLQRGAEREDLLAGLSYSIVQNYLNRVVCKRRIGERIFFQGGVAFNKAVVAAFEQYLGKQVTVPPDHEVTGAIGMALIAMKYMESRKSEAAGFRSKFKGFGLSQRPYEISSFECKACPNVCEINRVKIEGEKGYLFYGGRCEKYDVRKERKESGIPDLCSFRDELLRKEHLRRSQESEDRSQKGEVPARLGLPNSRPKIGIPHVFYFHDYLPFWTTLLWELGFDVEVSPETERRIVDLGLESVLSESCFPVKVAHGHIRYLLEKNVDAIFLPSFVDLKGPLDNFDRAFACPYTQTVPYTARIAFGGAKFLTPVVDVSRGDDFLLKELRRVLKPFHVNPRRIAGALKAARGAQEAFFRGIKEEGERIVSGLKGKAIVIVGRSYNALDRGINLNISKKLADMGIVSVPMDFLPLENSDIERDWPNMYWRAGQRILSAAKIIRAHPSFFALYVGNFSCGPDSFIIKYFEEEMSGKPFLHLEIDEHSADAGVITRCEAFLDSIGNEEAGGRKPRLGKKEAKQSPLPATRAAEGRRRRVFIPRMSDHAFAIAGAFQYCGQDAEVLPEPTKNSVDLGKKFVSGKECYPCAVTTGDMVAKIMEEDFRPDRSAFFMPSGSGPCRFGQYNVFQKLVIKELGLEEVPVLAPIQDENFYQHLGVVGKDFAMRAWSGVVAIELLNKCLRQIRPYEKMKGDSDAVYSDLLKRAYASVQGVDGDIEEVLRRARRDFEGIAVHSERRPLIGIVGEIFVRSNAFSNENLVRKIEALGGEAYLAPVEEWLYYVNYTGLTRVLIKKEWSGIINLLLKRFFQKRCERRFERQFSGFLKALHEPDTGELVKNAGRYVHPSFEGETILSIGKSVDLIAKGAAGLVNAMPFGCMPGTIVSGLMRGLSKDFGIPCLSMPYDGTESVTSEIQLEAFMDQAREHDEKVWT